MAQLQKTWHRGLDRVGLGITLTAAADILVRMRNLTAAISPLTSAARENMVTLPRTRL